jgi:hypothetical protein
MNSIVAHQVVLDYSLVLFDKSMSANSKTDKIAFLK